MVSIQIQRKLYLLPLFSFVFVFLSLFVTYGIAAGLGHVEANFPYISYTGLEVPERGIFGQLLNMGAILLALNVCARYLRISAYKTDVSRLNRICVVLGLLSAFGLMMVANFETKVMRGPHYFGAALGFGIGAVYCWVQAAMSWKLRLEAKIPKDLVFWSQTLISFLMVSFGVTFAVSKVVFKSYDNEENLKHIPGPVRSAYLTSTVNEWLLAISIMVFLLTYIPEFRRVTIVWPCLECDSTGNVAEVHDADLDSHLMTENGNYKTVV